MKLTSPAFFEHTSIPSKYSCDGINVHPPLAIENAPKTAQSLVLVVSDPDAPGGDFTHWLLWNIDPSTVLIDESVIPSGAIEGQNDFGTFGWKGPCPPEGTHRYEFCLYALDSRVDLPTTSNKTDLLSHMSGLILDECKLTGLYSKV